MSKIWNKHWKDPLWSDMSLQEVLKEGAQTSLSPVRHGRLDQLVLIIIVDVSLQWISKYGQLGNLRGKMKKE